MDTFFNSPNLAYWAAIIITVTATTTTVGQLWRRRENARWTLGYFIVFFWGYFMVLFGHFDAGTYLALFFAVGFAGAIKVGYEMIVSSREAERQRKAGSGEAQR